MQLGVFEVLGGDAYKERGWGDRGAPSPFAQGAVTAVVSGLSLTCRRFLEGGARVWCLRGGGAAVARPLHRTGDPPPPILGISQEFRVCVRACVCERARMAVLLSAKCFLRGCTKGRWGSPCSFAEPCVCVIV